jgi:hypothetical protein
MSITQISKIQVRTGNYSDLPVLSSGEFGYATDQERLFIGNPGGLLPGDNTEILTAASLLEKSVIMGGDNNINVSLGNYYLKTISGSTTLTVSNIPSPPYVACFILELTNGGSGLITWWSGVTWEGGTPPTLTASGVDVLGFYTTDSGTIWRGFVLGLNLA